MANESKTANNRSRGSSQPEKAWKDESDSPIEQAKMHPFIKKCMTTSAMLTLMSGLVTLAYTFSPMWNWDDGDVWDLIWLMLTFVPPILQLAFLKIQRTSKVREDE